MKRTSTIIMLLACIFFFSLAGSSYCKDEYAHVRGRIKSSYTKLNVGEIRETPITGVYEIVVGPNIIYYCPEKDLLIFGEFWTKEGANLTAARREELALKRMQDLPLASALKLGNGRDTVIEFSDPDCPHCRKAADFLKKRGDVARYVFFVPSSSHKDSERKVRYILCSKDRQKAYEEVMDGKKDKVKVDACESEHITALIKEHREIALAAGIKGTPTFMINGKVVHGANIKAMASLLDKKFKK